MLRVGSLFSGIGGFDLGLERAGMRVKWQVEIDEFARKLLTRHWPDVPKYGDIRLINWATASPVDVLCGGFPCQDLSFAGKRAGIDGDRSGLWSEYVRSIRALRPRYVIVENVPGLLSNEYMGRVLRDLAACGYDAEWAVLSACAMGAPHTRERVFILAYPAGSIGEQHAMELSQRLQGESRGMGGEISTWNSWAVHQPGLVGVAHGVSNRVDRLRGLGNAIVPQIAEMIGRAIIEVDSKLA